MELLRTSVPYIYVLALVLAVFALLGFKRGWAREGATLLGVLAAWAITAEFGIAILSALNRTARSLMFIFQGGMESDDPAALVRRLNEYQLADLQNPQLSQVLLFGVLALIIYLLAWRFVGTRPKHLAGKLAGSLLAIGDGFLVAFVMLQSPALQSRLLVTVSLPTNGPLAFARQYTSGIAVALVGIVIAFALLTTIRSARRHDDSGFGERRRA